MARLRPHLSESAPNTKPPPMEPIPYSTPISPTVDGDSFAWVNKKRRIHVLRAVREAHEGRHQQNEKQKRGQK